MMRRTFRRAVALTIAFALVASAATWRECTAVQLAAAGMANREHAFHAAHHHGGDGEAMKTIRERIDAKRDENDP
jgi:methylaspartate ammonia-lyase